MHWPLLRVKVAERSMLPALRPGDWLLVRRTRRIRAGQIVIARHPGQPGLLLVKRAVRRMEGDGGWWLESDNPTAGAVDSRRFGPVPAVLVEGRVLVRYWRPRSLSIGPNGPWCPRPLPENPVAPSRDGPGSGAKGGGRPIRRHHAGMSLNNSTLPIHLLFVNEFTKRVPRNMGTPNTDGLDH
jgi:nickel-type superoxide dismutase maturation protease